MLHPHPSSLEGPDFSVYLKKTKKTQMFKIQIFLQQSSLVQLIQHSGLPLSRPGFKFHCFHFIFHLFFLISLKVVFSYVSSYFIDMSPTLISQNMFFFFKTMLFQQKMDSSFGLMKISKIAKCVQFKWQKKLVQ